MADAPAGLRGLYAITDAGLQPPERLCERVSLAIIGGAALIQYRDKSADARLRLAQAGALAELCRLRAVPLIINDDVALAADCGADGVHLGRDDAAVELARRRLGDAAIIGVSCYNRLDLAHRAAEQGADYVAFGRFFVSGTKPDAVQADSALIEEAKRRWPLPVAVIGGLTPYNAAALVAAGADMLAVVRGVFAADDVSRAAAAYAALFDQARGTGHRAPADGTPPAPQGE
jgi:thiamine-phosphate pyrophosphorylase